MKKIVEIELAGRKLSLETGRMAREAGGAVVVRYGDTIVLATATVAEIPRENIDFFPLLVDFEEKLYAVGKIPGGFFKREGRPTEKAILTSRLIDRPIRPLFAEGFRNDVQIVITPLSVDEENAPDILAMLGASAALTISEIPFAGPAGAVRVGKINGEYVLNPLISEMEKSSLDLVVAGTAEAIMMIEAGCGEASEAEVLGGIEFAHAAIKKIVKLQRELADQLKVQKKEFELYKPNKEIEAQVTKQVKSKIEKALEIADRDQRQAEIKKVEKELEVLEGEDHKHAADVKIAAKKNSKRINA